MDQHTRIVRCPQCGRSTRYDRSNPDRPFCSKRCKTFDTAQWADESYRIPTQERPSPEDMSDSEQNPRAWQDED